MVGNVAKEQVGRHGDRSDIFTVHVKRNMFNVVRADKYSVYDIDRVHERS